MTEQEARAEAEAMMCPACLAYLAHYPIMEGDWECEHNGDEQAFMFALADAIHGPTPEGEFVDAGWRAAQFLNDAEVALACGSAPYRMRIAHNVEPWMFMALVNERYLIGTQNEDGAELELIADVGWLSIEPSEAAPSGHRPAGLTLTDDEVRALVRNATINTTPADTLTAALTAMERLRARAEDLINQERGDRRYEVPTDPALEIGCEGCE